MTTVAVADQICQYFGGAYDANTHSYRTPPAALTAAGLAIVKRGWAKRNDFMDWTYGLPVGSMTGCIMVVWLGDDRDHRVALPAIQGRRKVHYAVELHCFVWSKAPYAEDVSDFVYTLTDAIKARIRLDPTLGTGGIEAGNFQVGEGSEDGGGEILTSRTQSDTEDEGTKAFLLVQFEAHAYDVA